MTARSMRTAEFRRRWTGTGRRGAITVRADMAEPDGVVVGYATPRRIGGAVARNRVRRRARAVLRAAVADGTVAPGFYMVSFGSVGPDDPDVFRRDLLAAVAQATRPARR